MGITLLERQIIGGAHMVNFIRIDMMVFFVSFVLSVGSVYLIGS